MRYICKSILAGALFVLCITGKAQDTIPFTPDSIMGQKEEFIILSEPETADVTKTEIEDPKIKERNHSPRKAIIFSAVVPGLGQAYNKKYWKMPIIYIAGGALVYYINKYNTEYYYWEKIYDDAVNGNPLPPEYSSGNYNNSQFYELEKFYRRWRDFDIILLTGLYFLNIIDAMVDAYFYEYDIGDDLTLKIEPSLLYNSQKFASTGFKVSLRF